MPANLIELTDCMATALNYHSHLDFPPRKGALDPDPRGRGRTVQKATSGDAERLLIALMVCPTPARAPDYTGFRRWLRDLKGALKAKPDTLRRGGGR